jgi:hypothetical protein
MFTTGGGGEKDILAMRGDLTHQAAKVGLLFTHLSHEKKEKSWRQQKEREN